jgi:hypothetical protein
MSEMGQKAKYSRRADVFRFTPKTGHRSMQSACPKSANRRHRACTPLANFLSEDLAFTRKGQSEHNFSDRHQVISEDFAASGSSTSLPMRRRALDEGICACQV